MRDNRDILEKLRWLSNDMEDMEVPGEWLLPVSEAHIIIVRLQDEIDKLKTMVTPKPLDDSAPKDRVLIGVERPSMQWEPMATAPKDETPFLAYYRALDTIYEVIWHPERGEWVCYDYEIDNFCQSDFTAWMPSPKHPVNPDRIRRDWNAS